MERRTFKIFGVVMTLLLMFSLAATFAVTTPVVAGTTATQKWSEIPVPNDDEMQLLPDSDISTIAVTPDGKVLFAAVVVNQSATPEWSLVKSTDGGYSWKKVANYGHGSEEIVAIKVSPDWVNDGRVYVATRSNVSYSKDSGKTWRDMTAPAGPINSLDVGLDSSDEATVLIGSDDVYLYDETWKAQGVGSYTVLAAAFSPKYGEDGTIMAVVTGGSGVTMVRAETDVDANNWGDYLLDAYFVDKNGADFVSATACIAFPSDFSTTNSFFVGINTNNGSVSNGINLPSNQLGDAYKVSLSSGILGTSGVMDLDVRGEDTGTDVWSLAVSGTTGSAKIMCGARYVNMWSSMGGWEEQIHLSVDGGNSWSFSIKPASGMSMALDNVALCSPVVVMDPAFETNKIAYCGNGYDDSGIVLSGFYVSTDNGETWNGRGLLDHVVDSITSIAPSPKYGNDSTIFMVTQDSHINHSIADILHIGLLWKTVNGGDNWDLICNMVPLAPMQLYKPATDIDTVAISADFPTEPAVFITGAEAVSTFYLYYPLKTSAIYRSNDEGVTFPTAMGSRGQIKHLIAIDKDTLIAVASNFTTGDDTIWKTTNGGYSWTKDDKGEIASDEHITDIVLSGNAVLVGTDDGNVYICSDYKTDFYFEQIGEPVEGDSIFVAFDAAYATNHIVYTGIGGGKDAGIWRTNVDTDDDWEKINGSTVTGDITGIACDKYGILWALANGSALRSVNPTESTISKIKFEPSAATEEALNTLLTLVSGSTYVFAVGGTDGEGTPLNNKLFYYTDTLIRPTLISPSNGAVSVGDMLRDDHENYARVVLNWQEMSKATSYEYQVALDKAFGNKVPGACLNGTTGIQAVVELYAGTTYYWRVRATGTVDSQWSEIWSFTTPLGSPAESPRLLSPTDGTENVVTKPALQWSSLAYATKYELRLAEGCDYSGSKLVIDKTGASALGAVTAYQIVDITLKEGTNYCWQVRAVSDTSNSPWSDMGTFRTLTTPVTEEEDEGTPIWVWVVIALSAVLLVAVVMLIVRTRRA